MMKPDGNNLVTLFFLLLVVVYYLAIFYVLPRSTMIHIWALVTLWCNIAIHGLLWQRQKSCSCCVKVVCLSEIPIRSESSFLVTDPLMSLDFFWPFCLGDGDVDCSRQSTPAGYPDSLCVANLHVASRSHKSISLLTLIRDPHPVL